MSFARSADVFLELGPVDCRWIKVGAWPIKRLRMAWMARFVQRLEQIHVPWRTATILQRTAADRVNQQRIGDAGDGRHWLYDLDRVAPVVTKVVDVLEAVRANVGNHVEERGAARIAWAVEIRIRHTPAATAGLEQPQMRIPPSHSRLDDQMQHVEMNPKRHSYDAADFRRHTVERNRGRDGIVGGGLVGSIAAAMLGRAGVSTVLIDTHQTYPEDFRCEKIDKAKFDLLSRTGLAGGILRSATPINEVWIARFGRLIAKKRHNQEFGIAYGDIVNAARAQIPPSTPFACGKVTSIATSPDRQTIVLSNGQTWSVRLVILATGLNNSAREQVGIFRQTVSKCHSISIGFNIETNRCAGFDFPALTYFGETRESRIGYLTLFPIGAAMRANLFVYHDMHDPWIRALREAPQATLLATMPNLKRLIGEFQLASNMRIRPVDLYVTVNHRRPGIILVGDSFATTCPAAGTGVNKVLTDVERLCNLHIPRWLATGGMGIGKIEAYYNDPIKIACDLFSISLAYYMRSLTVDRGFQWYIRRMGLFSLGVVSGGLRSTYGLLRPRQVRRVVLENSG